MSAARRMAARKLRRAGFTLVELMIALVAGTLAVAGVYYLNGVSARTFGEQMRVSETQTALRAAMEQLRRDFARAGYLGVVNTEAAVGCNGSAPSTDVPPASGRVIRSIDVEKNGSSSADSALANLLLPAVNNVRTDAITLYGNYASADAYLIDTSRSDSRTLVLQTTTESFRRSFYEVPVAGGPAKLNDDLENGTFGKTFYPKRMLRVEHEGRVFLRYIQSRTVNASTGLASVELESDLPPCFDPSRWTAVAPVSRIRYELRSDADPALDRLRTPANAPPGARRALLVRRELDTHEPPDTTDALFTSSVRPVLDYAVELAVEPIVATATGFAYALSDADRTLARERPQTVSSVMVTLASRSAEAAPNFPFMPRIAAAPTALSNPLMTVRVGDPEYAGLTLSARVRTLRSEIFLQNQ